MHANRAEIVSREDEPPVLVEEVGSPSPSHDGGGAVPGARAGFIAQERVATPP